MRLKKGLIQVYTGGGKGKTTAAFGLALRAAGWGLKPIIFQFIKGNKKIGEIRSLEKLKIPVIQIHRSGKYAIGKPTSAHKISAQETWGKCKKVMVSGEYDLVVLDEINNALDYKLIDADEVIDSLKSRPVHVEVVLTGRGAPDKIKKIADLVTEMKKIKHPFDKKIIARKGIEY